MKGYEFGIKAPEDAKIIQWWGARAIYKPFNKRCRVEVLMDRQSHGEAEHTQEFKDFVNKFINKLEKECKLNSESNDIFQYQDLKFTGEASPKGSCGYLYIGCWEIV